jgi:hypothetical protein
MAFKLTKDQRKEKKALEDRLDSVIKDLGLSPDSELHRDIYTALAEEITTFCTEVAAEFQEDFEDRNERWQESEAGESAGGFIETWEGFTVDPDDTDSELLACVYDDFLNLPDEVE